mmetsp:Transcript_9362/g.28183  ORF Transcript_9362/g.28183 Transcript_9362/m.28183 type:complete len:213 (-) Transcript_9362:707-1345(-)
MPSLPKIKIPVHVFAFSLACAPGIAYAYYYKKNVKSDEEFEKILSENYGGKIQAARSKRSDITRMVQSVKNPGSDAEMEKKFEKVLYAGKSESKRHYAVDGTLYGTEEGERKRNAAEEERKKQKKDGRKKARKSKKKQKDTDGDESALRENTENVPAHGMEGKSSDEAEGRNLSGNAESSTPSNYKKSTVVIAAVGAVAAGVGILLGGNRSQ